MANKEANNFLYNEDIKERFLTNYINKRTAESVRSILYKTATYERDEWDHDLYDCSLSEIKDFLDYCSPSTEKAATVLLSIIRKYIQWAMSEGYSRTNIDITKSLRKNMLSNHINTIGYKTQYLRNKEEFYNLLDFCINYQDSGGMVLMYSGINGQEHIEATSLRVEDCYFDQLNDFQKNKIKVKRNGEIKTFTIDPKCAEILYLATKEEEYQKRNDLSKSKCRINYVIKTHYVLRPVHEKGFVGDGRISGQIINQRIKKIAKLFDQDPQGRNIKRLNPQTIFYSGLFHYLLDLEKEKGELTMDDYKQANERWGIGTVVPFETKDKLDQFKKMI